MKRWLFIGAMLLICSLAFAADKKTDVKKDTPPAESQVMEMFNKIDANDDGAISREEAQKSAIFKDASGKAKAMKMQKKGELQEEPRPAQPERPRAEKMRERLEQMPPERREQLEKMREFIGQKLDFSTVSQ